MPLHLTRLDAAGADRDALVAFLSENHFPFHVHPHPRVAEVHGSIDAGSWGGEETETLWIDDDDRGRIGVVRLDDLADATAMLDLRIGDSWRGQRLGAAALALATDRVFAAHPAVIRFEGQTREDNTAMRRTFERSGWVLEAYYRDGWPVEDGEPMASVAYSVLRRDWESGTTTPVPRGPAVTLSGELRCADAAERARARAPPGARRPHPCRTGLPRVRGRPHGRPARLAGRGALRRRGRVRRPPAPCVDEHVGQRDGGHRAPLRDTRSGDGCRGPHRRGLGRRAASARPRRPEGRGRARTSPRRRLRGDRSVGAAMGTRRDHRRRRPRPGQRGGRHPRTFVAHDRARHGASRLPAPTRRPREPPLVGVAVRAGSPDAVPPGDARWVGDDPRPRAPDRSASSRGRAPRLVDERRAFPSPRRSMRGAPRARRGGSRATARGTRARPPGNRCR